MQSFDIAADAAGGRRTTAVRLGPGGTRAALLLVLLAEVWYVYTRFADGALRAFSLGSLVIAAVQPLVPAKEIAAAVSAPIIGDPDGVAAPPSTPTVLTFGVLGAAGLGLVVHVWAFGAFNPEHVLVDGW